MTTSVRLVKYGTTRRRGIQGLKPAETECARLHHGSNDCRSMALMAGGSWRERCSKGLLGDAGCFKRRAALPALKPLPKRQGCRPAADIVLVWAQCSAQLNHFRWLSHGGCHAVTAWQIEANQMCPSLWESW